MAQSALHPHAMVWHFPYPMQFHYQPYPYSLCCIHSLPCLVKPQVSQGQ